MYFSTAILIVRKYRTRHQKGNGNISDFESGNKSSQKPHNSSKKEKNLNTKGKAKHSAG